MLIEPDSPLRRLPVNLPPRFAQFCDAVRLTSEMADLAYTSLYQTLLLKYPPGVSAMASFAEPFLLAWSVVDSAFRLYKLIESFPIKGKKHSPEYRTYEQLMGDVEELRNAVQHMDGDIGATSTSGKVVWGILTWLRPCPPNAVHSCILISGALMGGGKYQPVVPAGMTIREPLDHISLTLDATRVDLTQTMEALTRLIKIFELSLRESFKNLPVTAMGDMFLALYFIFNADGTVTMPATHQNNSTGEAGDEASEKSKSCGESQNGPNDNTGSEPTKLPRSEDFLAG
jgi:hypothetical protein